MAYCIECEEEYPDRRLKIGYKNCLACSAKNPPKPQVFIVDLSKTNTMVVTTTDEFTTIKGGTGSSKLGLQNYRSLR